MLDFRYAPTLLAVRMRNPALTALLCFACLANAAGSVQRPPDGGAQDSCSSSAGPSRAGAGTDLGSLLQNVASLNRQAGLDAIRGVLTEDVAELGSLLALEQAYDASQDSPTFNAYSTRKAGMSTTQGLPTAARNGTETQQRGKSWDWDLESLQAVITFNGRLGEGRFGIAVACALWVLVVGCVDCALIGMCVRLLFPNVYNPMWNVVETIAQKLAEGLGRQGRRGQSSDRALFIGRWLNKTALRDPACATRVGLTQPRSTSQQPWIPPPVPLSPRQATALN